MKNSNDIEREYEILYKKFLNLQNNLETALIELNELRKNKNKKNNINKNDNNKLKSKNNKNEINNNINFQKNNNKLNFNKNQINQLIKEIKNRK